ncbi:DNA-binding domain-containing protein [Dokdonella soli]|uniref:DNA-binding domain-containing protein n=1 Tax=Dokdonella soli TaxID=529810 RepID=A0ABN1IFS8_9GAMM
MSALAELQRELQASVLRGVSPPAALDAVVATPVADAAERLDVYVHAYRARLLEVLGNDFPGLRALAGAETFERLGRDYIEVTPSSHANVRWYGDQFAEFARTTSPWAQQPALAAMAAFEWAIGLAFDAAAQDVVDATEVAAIAPQAWPTMQLHLHASLQRLTLAWNAPPIRRALDHDEALPTLVAWAPAQPWIIWRKDATVRYRRLDGDEAAALDAIARGASFAEVCEVLCEFLAIDAVALRAAGFFRQWVEDQWVTSLDATP